MDVTTVEDEALTHLKRLSESGPMLARGDLVMYKDEPFFFQPNGTACYLYRREEDIGKKDLATYTAARTAVRLPNLKRDGVGKTETARERLLYSQVLSARVTLNAVAEVLAKDDFDT
jgi:hypothetical protein